MIPRPVVSDAAERIYARLRPYQEGDDAQWVLLHLCEAFAITLRKPTDAMRHDDVGSGQRRMYDSARAPAWSLDHLRQVVGLDPFPSTLPVIDQRIAIASTPRWRRCTPDAIKAVVRPYLVGKQRVTTVPRLSGNRWHYGVQTYRADTPEANEPLILAAIRKQKPTRFRFTFTVIDGWTLAEFEAAFDTLANAEGAFSTLSDLEHNNPI